MTQNERNQTCVLPLDIAVHQATKPKRGVVGLIADKYGIPYNKISNQLNPNNASHTLSTEVIEYVACETQDIRIVESLLQHFPNVGYYIIPECDGQNSDVMRSLGDSIKSHGETVNTIIQSLADGVITQDEDAKIEKEIMQAQGELEALRALIKKKARG